jgi:L-2-hydroxyglutarate oxidase LhgO
MGQIDVLIIGGSMIGLAIARALARGGRDVVILESEAQFGSFTSSRNSEAIHAGIYYPHGSLKARSCVTGRALHYAFCTSHNVAHQQCDRLIVATNKAEAVKLGAIRSAAHANGVGDVD